MPRSFRQKKHRSYLAALLEATESLRDLTTAVQWMLDTSPEASTFDFERRRVEMCLEEARLFVRDQDTEEEAADRAAEARLSL